MNLKENLIKIFSFFKPLRGAIFAQLLILICLSLISVAWPYYFGKIIDGVASGASFEELRYYLLIFSASLIGSSIFVTIRNVHEVKNIQLQAQNLLQEISIKKMTELSVGQHTRSDSGFKQSVLEQGSGAVQQVFFQINYDILPSLFRYVTVVGVVMFISPLIGIVSLCITVLQFAIYQVINIAQLKPWRAFREHRLEVSRWNAEIIRLMTQIIFRGASKEIRNQQVLKQDALQKHHKKTWVPYEYKTSAVQFLGDINLIVVVLLGIMSVTSWNTLTVGAVVAVLTYAMTMVYSIEGIYGTFRRLAQLWPRVEKFFDILELENDIKEPRRPQQLKEGAHGLSVEFKDVSFAHVEFDEIKNTGETKETAKISVQALDDVSFTIDEGEVCAIVGRSGAGKTTIVNLLLRAFDPDKGTIRLSGVPLKKISTDVYRRRVGIVEQEVVLQNTTLRHNILFGMSEEECAEWTDEKLLHIARITRLDQFFDRLGEEPFDAVVGERGIKLSGGQRQRVGIARALARNPALLVFDEATSSLDGENEKAIHDAMKEAFKGRTVIVIAHRLSTVRHADKIICVDNGTIAGIGTHNELYKTCEPYKLLVDIQRE